LWSPQPWLPFPGRGRKAVAAFAKGRQPHADNPYENSLEAFMFLLLAIILALAWITGFGLFHVASAAIHVLIVLAIISILLHVIRGKKSS
jgi:Family of unknown function (DUF5670)